MRRFPPPWTVEQIPGGYKVKDANGQSLAYVYGRETRADADIAHVLTMDEARRIRQQLCQAAGPNREEGLIALYYLMQHPSWKISRQARVWSAFMST